MDDLVSLSPLVIIGTLGTPQCSFTPFGSTHFQVTSVFSVKIDAVLKGDIRPGTTLQLAVPGVGRIVLDGKFFQTSVHRLRGVSRRRPLSLVPAVSASVSTFRYICDEPVWVWGVRSAAGRHCTLSADPARGAWVPDGGESCQSATHDRVSEARERGHRKEG